MKLPILAVLLMSASLAYASDSNDPVLDRLSKVGQFAFGGTGYAGIISQGEKDYRTILARPSAKEDFERLFSVGNSEAKAYALVGLRRIDPGKFRKLYISLHNTKEVILTQSGCIVSSEPLVMILKRIDEGDYFVYQGQEH